MRVWFVLGGPAGSRTTQASTSIHENSTTLQRTRSKVVWAPSEDSSETTDRRWVEFSAWLLRSWRARDEVATNNSHELFDEYSTTKEDNLKSRVHMDKGYI